MRFGGAIAQGVCCEAGPVDASGCVIFVSSGITSADILSCGKEGWVGRHEKHLDFFFL